MASYVVYFELKSFYSKEIFADSEEEKLDKVKSLTDTLSSSSKIDELCLTDLEIHTEILPNDEE